MTTVEFVYENISGLKLPYKIEVAIKVDGLGGYGNILDGVRYRALLIISIFIGGGLPNWLRTR